MTNDQKAVSSENVVVALEDGDWGFRPWNLERAA